MLQMWKQWFSEEGQIWKRIVSLLFVFSLFALLFFWPYVVIWISGSPVGLRFWNGEKEGQALSRYDLQYGTLVRWSSQNAEMNESGSVGENVTAKRRNYCIVIDAGHGGADSGKIGCNGALEKEINLIIAYDLKAELEMLGFTVVMTRTTDDGLYDEEASNHKMQDLDRRIGIMKEANPWIVVSIHQNSFGDSGVKGCQVFYYKGSDTGEELAACIQDAVVEMVQPQNNRPIKENDNYYLLKQSPFPMVIVECGFLSNPEDASDLTREDYQKQMAHAIAEGIIDFWAENQ